MTVGYVLTGFGGYVLGVQSSLPMLLLGCALCWSGAVALGLAS